MCKKGMVTEMKEVKGSKTEANLWAAFAGESGEKQIYLFFICCEKRGIQPDCGYL